MDEYSKDAGSMCSHSFQGSWQFGWLKFEFEY
jgi:hypothetical protein